jgi:hypothetical protein
VNVLGLFPTPVGISNLGRPFAKEELEFFNNTLNEIVPNSENSVSIDKHVLNNPAMLDIRAFITNSISAYLEQTNPPKGNSSVYITQSWMNCVNYSESHPAHYHPNSFISGVLYIDAIKEFDKIFFTNPNMPSITYPVKHCTIFNSQEWFLPVATGDLLLFPSSLLHKVKTKLESNKRVSLAFNTFLKGSIGSVEELNELIL